MNIAKRREILRPKFGVKSQRVSMIAALNQRKIIAPLTFEGYCNTELFNAWFEQF